MAKYQLTSCVLVLLCFLGCANLLLAAHVVEGIPVTVPAAPSQFSGGSHSHRDRIARRVADLISPSPSQTSKSSATNSASRVYHVTDYGADPTGKSDSAAAISKAISAAFAAAAASGLSLFAGIANLGGVEIHLDGGLYLISSPLVLPPGVGNINIHGGSLRAADDFPADRYLIELWAAHSTSQKNSSSADGGASSEYAYEFVTLRDLVLDCNYRGGGIAVVDSLRIGIDNVYIVHFTSEGVSVQAGHETMIRNSFIGQHITAGGDAGEKNFTGTGISLAGNDNAVTDVVIFSADIGVLVSGQANSLTGVHCYNKATGWGGTGIYLKLPGLTQTRITNCYLDYTGIVSEDPVQLHISGSFFLGDANVVLKSVKGVINGVDIVGNMFAGGGKDVDIVKLDGKFTDVNQVTVSRNSARGMTARSTAARATVDGNGTTWAVDFSPVLLFPDRIGHVQYTLVAADSAFPSHRLRNVSANRVVIESDVAVSATVHVEVDQGLGSMSAI
ncbi:polygalacturonase QRT3 [Canna indica]|uniref:Polygalacturonase QRT3 n=1 Tax=Canna indica TaxID=4628 RepID=A0AAQ3QNE1_9LILI|nr:polygalacturonase QRT3 [Canna indica]